MSLRELNDSPDHNYIFEVVMNVLTIAQIGLLCLTMQSIFVE
jgi:hypothetical protein